MKKTGVGIIGCGAISGIYLYNCSRLRNLELVALADLDPERAAAKVAEVRTNWSGAWKLPGEPQVPKACSIEQLLADPQVELVLNLTAVPKAHAEVAIRCIEAGKHEHHEKPFGVTRAEGRAILGAARTKGVRVGCAPDTFLGAGIQTCRKLIDDGWIGAPIGCTAFYTSPGHEATHQDPEFYYQVGGGPLFDMSPYYLTALVNLLGPITLAGGVARETYKTRTITSGKKYGAVIDVETPTHIVSTLEFAGGATGAMVMSFDVYGANLPRIEVYGTRGSLSVPDPNRFDGEVRVKVGMNEWGTVPYSHGHRDNSRGLGAADMAAGIERGRPHRASGELGYHVLDVMETCREAAAAGRSLTVASSVERPAPLPPGRPDDELD